MAGTLEGLFTDGIFSLEKPPAIEDNITQVIFLWYVLYISRHLSDVVAVKFYNNLTGKWACISITWKKNFY